MIFVLVKREVREHSSCDWCRLEGGEELSGPSNDRWAVSSLAMFQQRRRALE
jgi:hypothetical protein